MLASLSSNKSLLETVEKSDFIHKIDDTLLLHFLMRFLKVIYWTSHLNIISDALMQEFHAVNQTPALEF